MRRRMKNPEGREQKSFWPSSNCYRFYERNEKVTKTPLSENKAPDIMIERCISNLCMQN